MPRPVWMLWIFVPAVLLPQSQTEPGDWRTFYEGGLAQVRSNQLTEAKRFFEKAVTANPGFLPARKNLATVQWFLNERDGSEKGFREILKTHPSDSTAHLYIGLAEYGRKQYLKAKPHLEQSGELATANPEVLPILGEVYLATGDERGWIGLQVRLPGEAAAQFRLAQLALAYGKAEAAMACLSRVDASYPDPVEHGLLAAQARLAAGQAADSKIALQQLLNETTGRREDIWLALAGTEDSLNAPAQAHEAYAKALEAGQRSEHACVSASGFAASHANPDYAMEILAQCMARRPPSATLLLMKGLLTALRGDRAPAEQLFGEAMRANQEWPLPVLALGVSQLEGGTPDAAVSTFSKAAAIAPNDATTMYLLGTAYSRTGREADRAKAIAALRKAAAFAPRDARMLAGLGQAYLANGQTRKGIAELQQAITLDPHQPVALYQLGIAYRKLGLTEDSRRLLARFQAEKDKGRAGDGEMIQILKVIRETPSAAGSRQ